MRIRIRILILFLSFNLRRIRIRNHNTAKKYQNLYKNVDFGAYIFFLLQNLEYVYKKNCACLPVQPDPHITDRNACYDFLSLIMIEHNDLMLQLGLTPVVKYLLSQFGPGLVRCHRIQNS